MGSTGHGKRGINELRLFQLTSDGYHLWNWVDPITKDFLDGKKKQSCLLNVVKLAVRPVRFSFASRMTHGQFGRRQNKPWLILWSTMQSSFVETL